MDIWLRYPDEVVLSLLMALFSRCHCLVVLLFFCSCSSSTVFWFFFGLVVPGVDGTSLHSFFDVRLGLLLLLFSFFVLWRSLPLSTVRCCR